MLLKMMVIVAAAVAVGATTAGPAAPAAPARDAGYTAKVTNPWFPLRAGSRWVYRGVEGGRRARNVVTVAHGTAVVDGVPCAVLHDRLYRAGRLVERTTDWYTQDDAGTVWYYGEETAELDREGNVTSTEGSWRAGRDGARPGVYMPAHPKVGQSFAQEHYPGHAEDRFRVVALHATARVPYGTFRRRVLRTREWTPLEPGVVDRKEYVRGVGQIVEASVKGGSDRLELVSFRRG